MPTRVLLCDTADGLAQLQYALLKSGADLEGFRAVEVAARTQPAIVVAEIGLEGLAGADLIRRLLAIVPETSVICWTNVSSPVLAAEMLRAGASSYVVKEDGPEVVLRACGPSCWATSRSATASPSSSANVWCPSPPASRDLEGALTEVSERLESLTTAKADFLANISHELRTPVTVAKRIAYVLKNRGPARRRAARVPPATRGGPGELMMLIDEMLTIADLDRGTLTLKLTKVDLSPILSHVIDELRRQYPHVGIQLVHPEPSRAGPTPFVSPRSSASCSKTPAATRPTASPCW